MVLDFAIGIGSKVFDDMEIEPTSQHVHILRCLIVVAEDENGGIEVNGNGVAER